MIGSLVYFKKTRPDICFVVNTLILYMVEPRHFHLIVEKHILRYLKCTIDYGLRYTSDQAISLHGYVDSYWAGSVADRKITSRCCFSLGSVVSACSSRNQTSVALSKTEAEYIIAFCWQPTQFFFDYSQKLPTPLAVS
jgi:hypothetical protein